MSDHSYDSTPLPPSDDVLFSNDDITTTTIALSMMNAKDDDDYLGDYVLPKEYSIILVVTAGISLISSYVMLREVWNDHQRDPQRRVLPRLLMGLAVSDMIFSIGNMMSTFASPSDLDYISFNVGTVATCEVQGFLLILGYVSSPLFNTALAATYLRMVRHNATEAQLKQHEFCMHSTIWMLALVLASIPLPLNMYNNAMETCWIWPAPFACEVDDEHNTPCERGGINTYLYASILTFFPAWFCVILCGVILIRLYCTVRKMENAIAKYTITPASHTTTTNASAITTTADAAVNETTRIRNGSTLSVSETRSSTTANRTKSNTVAWQASLYIVAFFAAYIFWLIEKSLWLVGKDNAILAFIAFVILLPLQGFFNCLVFMRQRDMKTPEGRLFRKIICICCCCSFCSDNIRKRHWTRSLVKKGTSGAPPAASIEEDQQPPPRPSPCLSSNNHQSVSDDKNKNEINEGMEKEFDYDYDNDKDEEQRDNVQYDDRNCKTNYSSVEEEYKSFAEESLASDKADLHP